MWTNSHPIFRPGPPRLSRREMLGRGAAGFGLLGLAGLLGRADAGASPLPHFAPRAKRVIFLFMNGGPSHVDTFDPKPALARFAGRQPDGDLYRKKKTTGMMPSPLAFSKHGRSGIEVSTAGAVDEIARQRGEDTVGRPTLQRIGAPPAAHQRVSPTRLKRAGADMPIAVRET